MLTIIKPFQKTFAFTRTQSPCFESGFVQFESGFLKVKSGIFKHESGFSSSPSPGPSPGFEVCLFQTNLNISWHDIPVIDNYLTL
jgi:hypothetical protein